MEIICDTSFLMVLCYEPVKNIESSGLKIWKNNIFNTSKNYQRINTNKTTWQYKKIKDSKFSFRSYK